MGDEALDKLVEELLSQPTSIAVSYAVLRKGDRKVVLGGSLHCGYNDERIDIQKNIDKAREKDFLFFREGFDVKGARPKKIRHKFILYFLNSIGIYYWMWARANKALYIEEVLNFPKNVVTVDMKSEILPKLDECGFAKYWPLFILFRLSLVLADKYPRFLGISSILFRLIMTGGRSVFLGERDALVVGAIENNSSSKIYVHYGDGHIAGMRDLLVAHNWQIEEEKIFRVGGPLTFREAWEIAIEQTRMLLKYYIQHYARMLSDHNR